MSSNHLCFSKEEIQQLKNFFEQLHIDHRKFKDDAFDCKTEENDTVFNFSWKGSEWGYHDESWYDIAEFTLTKCYYMPMSDLVTDDKIICSIAEQAKKICITEQIFKRDFHFASNEMVIIADGFLGFSEHVEIHCHFCEGEW